MTTNVKEKNKGIQAAIELAGSTYAMAEKLGCTQPLIQYWLYHSCPAERAIQIEQVYGISRKLIRPDLFE